MPLSPLASALWGRMTYRYSAQTSSFAASSASVVFVLMSARSAESNSEPSVPAVTSRCTRRQARTNSTFSRNSRPGLRTHQTMAPGHEGFPAPRRRVQEPPPRRLQEVVIDSLQLVGERIDAGDGEAEEGIELVGDSKRVSLEPEAQQAAVGLECLCAV